MKSLLIVAFFLILGVSFSRAQNNCPGAGGSAGVNCTSASLCCGYGTITPSCLPADNSTQCCQHYLSSKQCKPTEVCGGGGGPGASSYTLCGPPGSTYCDKGDGQGTFCNATIPTCCGYYGGFGFCCAAGCSCNNSYYSCDCPAPSTPAPTTPAPTTPPPQNNCPGAAGSAGVNCSDASLCCGYGGISPSCLPADGSKKCCSHYISSKQCQPNEVCGGGGGPGASSYTLCGAPGTTYCDKGNGQGTFCNATQPTCCGNYGSFGFCCAAGCSCNNNNYQCNCPTAAPTTPAPTKRCVSPGPKGKPATCKVGQKCCGAKNTNAFCCNANQKCNNIRRTCM